MKQINKHTRVLNIYFWGLSYIFLIALGSCKEPVHEKQSKKSVPVRIDSIKTINKAIPVHGAGRLKTNKELKLSFKTGGIISSIPVETGDKVNKGTILAKLKMEEIGATMEQAKASYEKAERDLERAHSLYEDSAATLEQYQNAQTAQQVAKSKLETARFNLSHSQITAPSGGRILQILAKENEMVAPGTPVIYFGNTSKNWLLTIPVTDIDRTKLSHGDQATIIFDAFPRQSFQGAIQTISEFADPYTGTFEVELSMHHHDRFFSGLIASADIYPSKKQLFYVIPIDAFVELTQQKGYIYQIDQHQAQKHQIQIEHIRNEMIYTHTQLDTTLPVITAGKNDIRHQTKVQIQNP